jgi:hypothetical protein
MDPWPFDDRDWSKVEKIIERYKKAVFAADDVVCHSLSREMHALVVKLEKKYGEHPVLLETKADFTEGRNKRLKLYRRALELAVEHGMPTLTIRIWLAELLLEEFRNAKEARRVLKEGEDEFLEPDQEPDWVSKFAELWWKCRPAGTED